MPWEKGQSGNPGGYSKEHASLKKLFQENSAAAISRLIGLVHSDDERIALAAAEACLNRGYGKPVQALEHAGPEGGPIETSAPDIATFAKTLASVLHRAVEEGDV